MYTEWLIEQENKDLKRIYGDYNLNFKDPKKEKLIDFRRSKRGLGWSFNEDKPRRKGYQRKVRQRLKRNIYREEYYNIRCKDYKTYGWLTW